MFKTPFSKPLTPPPGFNSMESFLNASAREQSAAMDRMPTLTRIDNALLINSSRNSLYPLNPTPSQGFNTNNLLSALNGIQPPLTDPFSRQSNSSFFSHEFNQTNCVTLPKPQPKLPTDSTSQESYQYFPWGAVADTLKVGTKIGCHMAEGIPGGAKVAIYGVPAAFSLLDHSLEDANKGNPAKVISDTATGMAIEGAIAKICFPAYLGLKGATLLGKFSKNNPELLKGAEERMEKALKDYYQDTTTKEKLADLEIMRAAAQEYNSHRLFRGISDGYEATIDFISSVILGQNKNNQETKTQFTKK